MGRADDSGQAETEWVDKLKEREENKQQDRERGEMSIWELLVVSRMVRGRGKKTEAGSTNGEDSVIKTLDSIGMVVCVIVAFVVGFICWWVFFEKPDAARKAAEAEAQYAEQQAIAQAAQSSYNTALEAVKALTEEWYPDMDGKCSVTDLRVTAELPAVEASEQKPETWEETTQRAIDFCAALGTLPDIGQRNASVSLTDAEGTVYLTIAGDKIAYDRYKNG
mgnify:CR=1 FL=1